ncbi:MAG: outer membrane protein TolC [Planctomycetaceae bacterium]|jgi:outer membrane protein TolC
MWRSLCLLTLLVVMLTCGCQTSPARTLLNQLPSARPRPSTCPLVDRQPLEWTVAESGEESQSVETVAAESSIKQAGWKPTSKANSGITQAAHSQSADALQLPPRPGSDQNSENTRTGSINLSDVISSVLTTYPMVHAAALQFEIAQGQILSAEGAFDTKLKGATENGPLGFYETYRHSIGAIQPLANGGEVFGGYRVGRGVFQPWYKERQTNEGGEFKAGLSVPLSRNVGIDERRAGVRKAGLDLAAADPQFRAEVIFTVRAASEAYWQWVGAAAQQRIARQVLDLATTRNDGLEEEVRMGAKALPDLKDNRRSILSREAKLIDTQRKVTQTATKLSIFLRTPNGEPRIAAIDEVPEFPSPAPPSEDWATTLAQQAIQSRPELRDLDLALERIDVEIAEAGNDLLPNVNAVLIGSQDIGEPTSKKRDKSEFELEAALIVDVPLQRRKAKGKLTSLEAKRSQFAQKRRLSEDKIRTDIAVAFAAVKAAYERVQRTAEARDLADYMADVERQKFNAGESDLLKVALREEKAAESAGKAIEAQLEYQLGLAHLRAATGIDDGATVEWAP